MSADVGRVQARLADIAEQAAALRGYFAGVGDEQADPLRRSGLRYAVQTAAGAIMDVAYHLCARGWSHAPSDAHDALDFLAARGVLPQARLAAWHGLIGTRNRLVHGYLDASEARFLRDVEAGIADLDAFIAAVQGWLAVQGA